MRKERIKEFLQNGNPQDLVIDLVFDCAESQNQGQLQVAGGASAKAEDKGASRGNGLQGGLVGLRFERNTLVEEAANN